MNVVRPFVVILLLVSTGVVAASDETDTSDSARQWLDRMSHAIKTLNYEGTFVYIHDNQLEAMHIIHSHNEHGEQERLLSLAGSPREIIRDNDLLTCILPDASAVVVEKSRPKEYLPTGLHKITQSLKQYYRFSVIGDDRMAGRDAKIIQVQPRDPYRYGYGLWIDRQTDMLLKSDLLDEAGDAVEQVMFTNISIGEDIDSSQLKPTIDANGFKWFREDKTNDRAKESKSGWYVDKLPDGFKMGMKKKHAMPMDEMPLEHLMYTDGLSSVSVFIEKIEKGKPMLEGLSNMGAVNAYGTEVDGHHITVVGEVPKSAVKMIGDHVRYKPQPQSRP